MADPKVRRRTPIETLFDMLRQRRPHGSDGEAAFMEEFIRPLGVKFDDYGNAYKAIGESPIVWSSHVDTVHDKDGAQMVVMDKEYIVRLHKQSKSNCLGADDTAGVWLMRELILANRPGLYIFHRGEERGCLGSHHLVDKTPGLVKDRKAVIALDRKGYGSVITRQWGGRCCSDEFAKSFAAHMGADYDIDTGGSVTDSAQYTDLVGECTNLSVGYLGQHSSNESLHIPHLNYVLSRLKSLDASKLEYKREPGDKAGRYTATYHYDRRKNNTANNNDVYAQASSNGIYVPMYYQGGYWQYGAFIRCSQDLWRTMRDKYEKDTAVSNAPKSSVPTVGKKKDESNVRSLREADGTGDDPELISLVYMYPKTLARMLADWGFDADQLKSCMYPYGDEAYKEFHKKDQIKTVVANDDKKAGDNPLSVH